MRLRSFATARSYVSLLTWIRRVQGTKACPELVERMCPQEKPLRVGRREEGVWILECR